jgi:hypothetical protein
LSLIAGEQNTGGEVRDGDGRLIVVGPGGAAIGGGGGGTGADPLSDGTPGGALPTRTLWIAGANGSVLQGIAVNASGHVLTAVQNFPASQAVSDGGGSLTVDGTVAVSNFPATQPVSLATNTPDVTDRAARLLGHVTVDNASLPVTGTFFQATQPVSGTVTTNASRAGTGTATSVASTITTNTTILAANAARFGASIYNESTAVLFLLLGAGTESATVYTLQMAAGSYYETPFGFTGIIKGHWATANGSARIVEYT